MRSLADVIKQLSANPDTGLTDVAALQSKQQFGKNELTPLPREPLWKKFIEKFDEPIIKILLAAALLSMVVDLFKVEPILAGISLAVFAGLVVALYVRTMSQWLPSLLFVFAILMFFLGLVSGHFLVEGLAV